MSERIIIAEDDEDLAFVLREALGRQRYDVEVAPTAGGLLDGLVRELRHVLEGATCSPTG